MTTKLGLRICSVLVALVVATSCSKPASDAERYSPTAADTSASEAAPLPAPPPVPTMAAGDGIDATADATQRATPDAQLSSTALSQTDGQRKFVRTANLRFRVKDVYRSALALEDVAAARGGFVIKNDIAAQVENVQRRNIGNHKLIELAEYTLQGQLIIRVPSEQTQAFLRALAQQIDFLDQRNFEAMDVQFNLLREALAYQRSQATQHDLSAIAQQGGKPDQRAAVIGARDSAQRARDEAQVGQLEIADKVAFSTIQVDIYQPAQIRSTELTDVDAILYDSGPTLSARLAQALRDGWHTALDLLVLLVNAWPIWLLLGVAVFAYRQLRKARAVTTATSNERVRPPT